MDEAIRTAMQAFLDRPTPDSYRGVRALVVASPHYQPYSRALQEAEQAYREGQYDQTRKLVGQDMPNLLLSPHAHLLLAMASQRLGDSETEGIERYLFKACLDALLSSGDGSLEQPFEVTRISDEYAVLRARQQAMKQQALLHQSDRVLDRIDCEDGSTVHFDMTDAYRKLRRLAGYNAPELTRAKCSAA